MRSKGGLRVVFIPRVEVKEGTTERTPKLLQILSDRYEVTAVPQSRFGKLIYDQKRSKLLRYILFPLDEMAMLLGALKALRRGGGLAFAEGSYFALVGVLAGKIASAPSVWDSHGDIVAFSKALGKSGAFTKANVVLERAIGGMASRMLVVSEVDRRAYGTLGLREEKIMVLPTCADMELVRSKAIDRSEARRRLGVPEGRKVVLFFGTLTYRPNMLAAKYIVEQLAPGIEGSGDTLLCIAGSGGFSEPVPENVRFLGFVPDLYVWLAAADVCVAPIWEGVGILTKVIDMLSMGKPVVVSPLAVEGIPELEHRVNCLIGRDRDDFMLQLRVLLADESLQAQLGNEGRMLVEASYSWQTTAPRLFAMLDELGQKAGR